MQKITFTENLAHNIALMQSVFEGDDTFIVREATGRNGLHCAMFFFDGMVDSFTINESLVRPVLLSDRRRASADELAGRILQADDCRVETDMDKALAAFLYGDTLVLTEGDARPLVVNTKGFARRSPEEPENERVLSGPREGFTECFMPNLALIRRRVRDTRLKFNFLRVGGRTNTAVCLCYIDGLCPAPLVDEMRTRLSVLELDSVLDANYIAECLCDHRFSPFPTLGTTERPDVAASRLLEGRCALVVDGSPVVLTAPHLLQECFQSNDDYYISFLRTNVSRVLRTLGFLCSVTILLFMKTVQRLPRTAGSSDRKAAEAISVTGIFKVEAKFSRKEPHPEEHASFTRMFVMIPWSSQIAFISWPPISRRNVISGMYWKAALAWATVSTTWYSVENALENSSSPYPVEPQPRISKFTPASRNRFLMVIRAFFATVRGSPWLEA